MTRRLMWMLAVGLDFCSSPDAQAAIFLTNGGIELVSEAFAGRDSVAAGLADVGRTRGARIATWAGPTRHAINSIGALRRRLQQQRFGRRSLPRKIWL